MQRHLLRGGENDLRGCYQKDSACGGGKTFVRRAENFCAHGNKFPCGRKYFFVRTEIYLLPQENLPNLAERSNALFNNKLIYHDQDQSC